jgi:hypothetical protein
VGKDLKLFLSTLFATLPLFVYEYFYMLKLHDLWTFPTKCTESSYAVGHICQTVSSTHHKILLGLWLLGLVLIFFIYKKAKATKLPLILALGAILSIISVVITGIVVFGASLGLASDFSPESAGLFALPAFLILPALAYPTIFFLIYKVTNSK